MGRCIGASRVPYAGVIAGIGGISLSLDIESVAAYAGRLAVLLLASKNPGVCWESKSGISSPSNRVISILSVAA